MAPTDPGARYGDAANTRIAVLCKSVGTQPKHFQMFYVIALLDNTVISDWLVNGMGQLY